MIRSRLILFALGVLAPAGLLQAAYNWYYTDALTSISGTYWTQNGSLTAGSTGITTTSAGSLVSLATAPTYPNDYQVSATINLPGSTSGGNYGILLRATSNALMTSSSATGSFYLLELQNPTFSSGTCTATLVLQKVVSGSPTTLFSGSTWCSSSFTIGATISGPGIVLFVNNTFVTSINDSGSPISSGQPGVNIRNAPAGNTIGVTQLGVADKVAPGTVDMSNLSTSSYPNRIDMQWKGVADDVNGSGIAITIVYRGSSALNGFPANIGEFTDNTVAAGTAYTYNIISCDMFYNCSNSVFSATSAPAGSIDPRQIGNKPTSTTWGGGGENINILSGNLNFSLPLLTAKGRGGMTLGIGLNYNSQNWRKDASATWNYGRDLGYGYGFRLGAGSIQEYVNGTWGVDHWTFTDSTGTEYRLDKQVNQDGTNATGNTGIWATSTDSAAFLYNANNNRLYFPSGTFWEFACASLGIEGDYSARYPTLIEDTNGNQILIRYKPGVLAVDSTGTPIYIAWPNSSGRIDQIEDVRAVGIGGGVNVTYQFNYAPSSGGLPHLNSITNNISTSEGYSFTYNSGTSYAGVPLTSPWGTSFGNTWQLTNVGISGVGTSYSLAYTSDGSSTLTQANFPYGGYLRWTYTDGVYSGSRTQREVLHRYLSADGTTASETPSPGYYFSAALDSTNTMRQSVYLSDGGGIGIKAWTFNGPTSTYPTLISQYLGLDTTASPTTLQLITTSWTSGNTGPYISSTSSTMDPYSSSPATKRVDQVIDQWGNLLQMQLFDYGSSTPRRTYKNVFMTNVTSADYYTSSFSAYTSKYIRNRLLVSTVDEPTGTTTMLARNVYDSYAGWVGATGPAGAPYPLTCGGSAISTTVPAAREFDSSYTSSVTLRGNVTQHWSMGGRVTCMTGFDNTGNPTQTVDPSGVASSIGSSGTNFAAPTSITVGSLTSSFGYASSLFPTSSTGPNMDTASAIYDTYARPQSTTSKSGAVTYYSYVNYNPTTHAPAQTLAYTNGRVTRTSVDGFGRPIKVESGTGTYAYPTVTLSTIVSTVDSVYAACGCSPLGKLSKVSRPYAPGGTVYWTVYSCDGIGRTKSVQSPDGSITTTYAYLGATLTVADAAGRAKKFTTDAVGNLTQVNEDPTGLNLATSYSFDVLGRLRTVTMTRSGTTQTRTFTYTGALLTSLTNPENGTVNNYYNADNTLNYKVDAIGQKTSFTYDSYKRVIQITKTPVSGVADPCQQINYYYDTNPDISSPPYNSYTAGRLTSIHYAGANCQYIPAIGGNSLSGNNYIEMYAYTQAGQVTNKRLRLSHQSGTPVNPYSPTTISADLEALYTYDGEGKMLTVQYPLGTKYQYAYDSMGRPTKLTDTTLSSDIVSGVTYGPAGEVLLMTGSGLYESRSYNVNGQLTEIANYTGLHVKYNYPAGPYNSGQISSQQDLVSGEAVTYAYDSLKRLSSASSTAGWGQSFGYDGFGNLTSKSALSGSPPVGVYTASLSTNRLTSEGYDANGNQTSYNGNLLNYDISNRMTTYAGLSTQGLYEYDPSNRRVNQAKQTFNGSIWITNTNEYYFYGIEGKKYGTYVAPVAGAGSSASMSWTLQTTQVFFRSKLVQVNGASGVQTDRLGSVGSYYPYGEDRTGTANDAIKFATYTRDSLSGLDYAVNRYHLPGLGRFSSADPFLGSAKASSPLSWNRYSYVQGDPIQSFDSLGLFEDCEDGNDGSSGDCIGSSEVGGGLGDLIWDPSTGAYFDPTTGQYIQPQDAPPPTFSTTATGCSVAGQQYINGTCDVALNATAQQIGSLLNQMNPGGFINASAAAIGASYGLGIGGATLFGGLITGAAVEGTAAQGSGIVLNIGGEGEVAGAINFQPPPTSPTQVLSNGLTIPASAALGNVYVIGSNAALPFAPGSISTVITNSTPIFIPGGGSIVGGSSTGYAATWLGPTLLPSEVWTVLSSSGVWINNGLNVPRP